MANDAAKIKYGLENPPRAEQRAQQLKEETTIFSNFRTGAMNVLARV